MKRTDFISAVPVNKGWSRDRKYRVRTADGRDCLLRLSDAAKYESKKREYEIIQKYAAAGLPVSQPIEFGLCEDGVFMLLSWVEGEDLETVLPTLSEAEQYRLGRSAGRILKQIHSIPVDPTDQPQTTKREHKLRQLSQYEQSQVRIEGDERVVQYVKENIGLIWRLSPVYQHGDFHPGNLVYRPDGSIGVIDFNRWKVGDPYEEFYKLQSFGREVSIPYCVGQLDAYFDGNVPEDFWRTLAVYVAHASLFSIKWAEQFGKQEVEGMIRRCRVAMEDYDGFRTAIPRWYTEFHRDELQLYLPKREDGWFYVKMLSDPATMAYNAPWFPPDGCIPNAEAGWERVCKSLIGHEPVSFFAFLQRKTDGVFVGDVHYHYTPDKGWWDMGVLIDAQERGKGYGRQGLRFLLDQAFRVDGISRLHNNFERSREAAYHIHKAAGFREVGEENGCVQLELMKDDYIGSAGSLAVTNAPSARRPCKSLKG